MTQDSHSLYRAIIFGDKPGDVGERVSIYAESLMAAKEILEKKYGEGTVFDLHNENDADTAR